MVRNLFNTIFNKKSLILISCLFCIIFCVGCEEEHDPGISTPGFVDKIGDKATPLNSYSAVKPTPNQNVENIQNSTALPYDPVINFTDPYFENVVRDILGKSIGDIVASDVSGITTLKARVKGIRNISDIVYFTSLEELDLYGNKINDISPLAQLQNLKVLNIGKNYNTLYSSGSAAGINGLNLNMLSSLPLLEELYAEDNKIADLNFVEGLAQLKVLNLSNNNLTEVSALKNLSTLQTLILSGNHITDLTSIAECYSLTYLDISNNYFEVIDTETHFYTGYGIKDLSFCKKMTSLSYINVSMNMVTTLKDLISIKSLRSVYADDNYITDISYLKNNDSIQLLSIKRNYVKDFKAVNDMKALTELYYIGNPIIDSAPLKKFETQNL